MAYQDLRSKSLEDVVNEVQALSAVATESQVRSAAAVAARCTIALADGMQSPSDTTFVAKKQIVERLDELSTRIKAHEDALRSASDEASALTRTLLRWNKALVIVTGVYTLISFLLLVATFLRSN